MILLFVVAMMDITLQTYGVILKATELETIENLAIYDGKIEVICSDRDTYDWLKDVGVKAKYRKPQK